MAARGSTLPGLPRARKGAPSRVAFLVPRRDDHGHRDALWRLCRARWEELFPGWPVVEGHHAGGPFNRAAAINTAARLADEGGSWDVGVIIDSDVYLRPDQVEAAVRTAHRTGRVTWAHREWVGLTERATRRALGDGALPLPVDDDLVEKVNPISWSCCIAVPRPAWETIGGFDERFRGWGWEDIAFQALACGLVGHERVEGPVYHLWHPRSPGLGRASTDAQGHLAPEAIQGARLGRRYMVALRRDHGITDRTEPSDAATLERDIANLRSDDARLAVQARRLGMPDWSDWWPTLEELRSRELPSPAVALVVHSGGSPEAWPERSAYLKASLASIGEHVRYPRWERRVIFSDWGASLRAELEAIAAEYGYYVVGPAERQGYTGSMRAMWRYIAGHVRADYVFQAEDDFLFLRDVDLGSMVDVLATHPGLHQLALLREPYYPAELAAGTLLGHPLDAFTPARNGAGTSWLEHRRFFTVNPMLMRTSLASRPWPTGPHSEAQYGKVLLRDRDARFAFWGEGEPWIRHIGDTRAGAGY